MLSVSTTRNSALREILSFTCPRLYTGLCWFISFYAFDPAKGALFPGIVSAGRNFGLASGYDIFGMEVQPGGKRGFLVLEKASAFRGEYFFYKSLLDE